MRLGTGPEGKAHIRAHKFFAELDWSLVEARGLVPPFIPAVKVGDGVGCGGLGLNGPHNAVPPTRLRRDVKLTLPPLAACLLQDLRSVVNFSAEVTSGRVMITPTAAPLVAGVNQVRLARAWLRWRSQPPLILSLPISHPSPPWAYPDLTWPRPYLTWPRPHWLYAGLVYGVLVRARDGRGVLRALRTAPLSFRLPRGHWPRRATRCTRRYAPCPCWYSSRTR